MLLAAQRRQPGAHVARRRRGRDQEIAQAEHVGDRPARDVVEPGRAVRLDAAGLRGAEREQDQPTLDEARVAAWSNAGP